MELRVLRYFLAVAREENITKAAEQLHVTQPTLSRQIADLERELDVKLFTRSSHSILLTEEGMILKRRAQEILSLADKTKRDFLSKDKLLEGTISIGSGEFLSTGILTDCIAAFRKLHPLVRYEVYSGNTGNIKDNIERGLLDIGLILDPVDLRKYEFIPMPVREQWGAFVRIGTPLAEKRSISPADLVGIPLIASTGEAAQSNVGKWLGVYQKQVEVIAGGNLLYNQALLAQSNVGATMGVRLNCSYDGLRFVPFSPVLEAGTSLVWKKEQVFPAAVSSFMEFAKKYIAGISCDNL